MEDFQFEKDELGRYNHYYVSVHSSAWGRFMYFRYFGSNLKGLPDPQLSGYAVDGYGMPSLKIAQELLGYLKLCHGWHKAEIKVGHWNTPPNTEFPPIPAVVNTGIS